MNTDFRRRTAARLGTCILGASCAFWLGNVPTRKAALEQKTAAVGETRPLHVEAHGSAHEQDEALPRNTALDVLRLLARAAKDAPQEEHTDAELTGAPHPITADHQRLYRDVDLLRAADQAIRLQRYAEARALLAEHHRELPGMSPVEEEGLLLLADCAELRSPASVASVQQFYDRHTASTVRRQLRRGCLEQQSP